MGRILGVQEKNPKGERLVFQTPDSQWECGLGPAQEGHCVGEGNGQPRAYIPIGGQRGEGGLCPMHPSPGGGGGDRNREPGEMGCFGRARGGRPRRLSVSVGRGMRELRSWQLWR